MSQLKEKYEVYHGCIRMHPDDVEALFDKVKIGSRGEIIYAPVLLAQLADGRIFLEVHRDIYAQAGDPLQAVRNLSAANALDGQIDWERANDVVRRQVGLAMDVTRVNTAIYR